MGLGRGPGATAESRSDQLLLTPLHFDFFFPPTQNPPPADGAIGDGITPCPWLCKRCAPGGSLAREGAPGGRHGANLQELLLAALTLRLT